MIWDMPEHCFFFFFNSSGNFNFGKVENHWLKQEHPIYPSDDQIKISNKDLAKTTTGLSLLLTQWLRTGMLLASRAEGNIWHIACPGKRAEEKVSYIPGALHVCRAPQSHLPAPWPWVPLGRSASHPGWQRICPSPDASGNSKVGTV